MTFPTTSTSFFSHFYFILRQMNYFTRNDTTIKEYWELGCGNMYRCFEKKNIKSLYCILPEHGLCDAWEWKFILWFCYKAAFHNTPNLFIQFQKIKRVTEFNDKPNDSYQQQKKVREEIVLCTLLQYDFYKAYYWFLNYTPMDSMITPRYCCSQWNIFLLLFD